MCPGALHLLRAAATDRRLVQQPLEPHDRTAPQHHGRDESVTGCSYGVRMSESDALSLLDWPKSVTIVADASALLQDLRFAAGGPAGILGQLARLGYVVAPLTIMGETERRLPKMIGNGTSGADLREAWIQYQRSIRVVDTSEGDVPNQAGDALRRRDPTDLPLLVAALALGRRTVIATADLDLIALGLAPDSWLDTARTVEEVARVDAMEYGLAIGVGWVTVGSLRFVAAAVSGRAPAWLPIGLVASLAWVFAEPKRRDRLCAMAMRVLDTYCELASSRDGLVRRLAVIAVE